MGSITIRSVPDAPRDELAARAARSGRSLQEYLLAELNRIAEKPDLDLLIERTRRRKRATGTRISPEEIIAFRDADPTVTTVVDASSVTADLVDDDPASAGRVDRWDDERRSART